MRRRLNFAWRLFATGFCFVSFGVGGVLLWVLVFPTVNLFIRERSRRALTAKWVIRHAFRFFVGQMHLMGIYSYDFTGIRKLNRTGLLILANHPSLIDVVFLMSIVTNADCVVKASLLRNPFTRGAVKAAGFICNDQGPALMEDCIATLKQGNNLIIFPEGTRTPVNQTFGRLQRGASNMAVRGGVDITPILIRCNCSMLSKGVPWWKIPPKKPHFSIAVQDDLSVAHAVGQCATEAIAARHLNTYLSNYFSAEIALER
jgi:1-acyl-sn-glycerol-3-phosphate acyltransferase